MKKIYLFSILILIVTLLDGCVNNIEKKFYETGPIKERRTYISKDDSANYHVESYYQSGQVKSKGSISNNLKNGYWQEWYGDGSVKWAGDYMNGTRIVKVPNTEPKIMLEDTILRVGVKTYLRVTLDNVHPEDMAVACTNGTISLADDNETFDYVIVPKERGFIKLLVYVKKDGRMLKVSADSLNVIE